MANPNPSPATRWKKGQSGNPNGRPSFLSKVEADLPDMSTWSDEEWAKAMVERTIQRMREGDIEASWYLTKIFLDL